MRAAAENNDALPAIVEPLLVVWRALREQAGVLDSRINAPAKADAVARRLMTIPGAGWAGLTRFSGRTSVRPCSRRSRPLRAAPSAPLPAVACGQP